MHFSSSLAALVACLFPLAPVHAEPATPRVLADLAYKSGDAVSDYERERCKLDLYLPVGAREFPTLVWFHGGGLTKWQEDQEFTAQNARTLAARGIAVAVAYYRLSPRTPFPGYVEDAAAAVAWTRQHIAEHGGAVEKIFVGGHSAGAYLSSMVGMDARFLGKHGLALDSLAGLVLLSSQMMTHYTVRAERGIPKTTIVADEAAPIYHSRKDGLPMLVLYADHDMPSRAEENAYFVAVQHMAGNDRVIGRQIADRDHTGIAKRMSEPNDETMASVIDFIENRAAARTVKP